MVATGVTVPSASMYTGTSARRAVASPTVTRAPPPGPPGPLGAGRWIRYQAAPPSASTTSKATSAPSQRPRRDGGAWEGMAAPVEAGVASAVSWVVGDSFIGFMFFLSWGLACTDPCKQPLPW